MSAQSQVNHGLIQDKNDPVVRETIVVLKGDSIAFFTPMEATKNHTTQKIMAKLGYKPEPFKFLRVFNGWLFFQV